MLGSGRDAGAWHGAGIWIGNGAELFLPSEEPPEPEEADSERVARVQKILDELNAQDSRDHMNVVFIGHVDTGKSTLG